jgi:hypothetical protein
MRKVLSPPFPLPPSSLFPASQRKKMDPNMSSSRIKIAYSASSFSYSEDNPLTSTSFGAAGATSTYSTYTHHYAHKHQETIVSHLETVLVMCGEVIRYYLTGLSEFEVNLPVTLVCQVKAEWDYLQEKIKKCVAEERERNVMVSLTEYHAVLRNISELFSRPKHEVYMVLRDDCYARFKRTPEFDEYILKMRPYSAQERLGGF